MSGSFDRSADAPEAALEAMRRALAYDRTLVQPGIVHFGTGRRFRAAVGPLVDRMLALGHLECGIIAVSETAGAVFDALTASEGRYQVKECSGDRTVISEIGAVLAVKDIRRDAASIIASIADPRAMLITLTLSDQALGVTAEGRFDDHNPDIARDLAGAEDVFSPIGQIVAGLAARRAAGLAGLTIMTCDNVMGSNLRLAGLVDAMAVARDVQLADWIAMNCRFPAVYADRLMVGDGGADGDVAAVATEAFVHWVVEDSLGHERSALDDAGVALVSDVAPFLSMRNRLLDGGLLLLGCSGLLRGHDTLDQAMAEPELASLFDAYLAEAAAVLQPITGFDLDRYAAQIKPRLANRAMRLPLAICVKNGSARLPQSALVTIVESQREGRPADAAAAMVAAWIIHCTSPDLDDRHAEALWQIAAECSEDWGQLVDGVCGFAPIFGSIGQKPVFRELVRKSVKLLPGLASLVDD